MTYFYTNLKKYEAIAIVDYLKKLKVRLIPESRVDLVDNYIIHPRLLDKLVDSNKYYLVNSLVNICDEGLVKDYDSFFEGLTSTERALKSKYKVKGEYIIQLKTNVYVIVKKSFFEIFLIEGTLFRKASIELVCKDGNLLNVFRIRRPL